jgi:hypothetical protein
MRYLLLIILLTGIVSCGKKTQIKITAKNAATGQGYAGLGFRLKEVKPYTTSTGEVQKTVYEGTFNAQGEAVFEYRLKNRSYIITTLVPEEELCYINDTQYFLHRDDDNLKFDFRFAPCAYLQQNIQNVNCEGPNDVFIIRDRYSYTEWTGWSIDLNGCFSNVGGGYSEVPAGTRYFEWKVTRPSGVTTGIDTVVFVPGQNADLTIFY